MSSSRTASSCARCISVVGMVITVYLIRLALEGWKRLRVSQAMLTEREEGADHGVGLLLDVAVTDSTEPLGILAFHSKENLVLALCREGSGQPALCPPPK